MPPLKIDRFLSAEGDFQPVIAKAREIDALSKLCGNFLPPELARLARVANFKDGTLVIIATNGSVAAKLKLLGESLSEFLSQQGPKVNSVLVRVQPTSAEAHAETSPRLDRRLSQAGCAELETLHGQIEESPFRRALKELLERHQARAVQEDAQRTAGKEPLKPGEG